MRRSTGRPRVLPVAAAALALLLLLGMAARPARADTHIFIVRHAEKVAGVGVGNDPGLLPEGRARAALLRQMLRDVPLAAIYTSQYQRTRLTAQPTADDHKLSLRIHPGAEMKSLADTLRTEFPNQNVLVVGHINTAPDLLKELGVELKLDIQDSEYDNLFLVTLDEKGRSSVLRLHYGE